MTDHTPEKDPEILDAEIVEDTPTVLPEVPEPDYSESGVPSFDHVRERIEQRYTTSIGATELAGIGGKEDVASLDKKIADRDQAAKDKLAEIRRSMREK
jgi:phage shock protein A